MTNLLLTEVVIQIAVDTSCKKVDIFNSISQNKKNLNWITGIKIADLGSYFKFKSEDSKRVELSNTF